MEVNYLYKNDFIYLLPEVFFVIGIVSLLLVGVIYEEFVIRVGKKLVSVLLDLSILLVFFLFLLYYNSLDIICYSGLLIVFKSELALYSLSFVTVINLCYLTFLRGFLKDDTILSYEYVLLLLLSFVGVLFVLVVNSFLMLYLVIELQTLCFYILVSYKQNSDFNLEAGLKYFVLGSFISGFLLFGISLFYGFTGIINFSDIWYYFYNGFDDNNMIVLISVLFIFCGLLFKVGSAPFHMWVIDVYGGSCYSFLSYVAVVPKISLFLLLLKLYFMYFIEVLSDMNLILIYCSMASVFIGTIGALLQTSVKRLLAYSAISHVGYIILGFVAGSIEGFIGVVFYVFVYVLIMLSIFGVFMVSRDLIGNRLIHNLSSVNSLYESNKIVGLILLLGLFSVAGIPPLIGFFSKLYIYFGLLTEGFYMFLLLIILMSVVGVVYYIRLIRVLFFTEKKRYVLYSDINTGSLFLLSILSLCGIYFIFYSKFIILSLNNLVLFYMI